MKLKHEPVLAAAGVVALVEALIVMAVLLGWLDLSTEQTAAVMTFVAALIAVCAPLAGAFVARRKVFPLAKLERDEAEDEIA